MKMLGLCHHCGKPAMLSCALCGKIVCRSCYLEGHGVCIDCAEKRDAEFERKF